MGAKRGQLAMFIVVGIALLMLVGTYLYFARSQVSKGLLTQDNVLNRKIANRDGMTEFIKLEIERKVKDNVASLRADPSSFSPSVVGMA